MRICYLHPSNPNIIIKIEKKGTPYNITPNKWEYRHYQEIVQAHGEVSGLSRIFGIIETQFGKGLMAEAIRDPDGSLSPTLAKAIQHPDKWNPSALLKAVKDLMHHICDLDIRLFDFNLENIILQTNQQNELQAIIIDLKGHYANHEWIPISSWFDFFGRKKRDRRILRLIKNLEAKCNKKTNPNQHNHQC